MSDPTVSASLAFSSLALTDDENESLSGLLNQNIIQTTNDGLADTVIGADAPYALAAGSDGLYFVSGTNSTGGAISVEGGSNTILGGQLGQPAGLLGNWEISSLGGQTVVWFGTGADTFSSGGADTVHAGGAAVLITVADGNAQGTVINPGAGAVTFLGGASGDARILAGGTGGGLYMLGSGGGNIAHAGAGNTTLIGGGGGDVLYANTITGAQGTLLQASGNDTLIGGGVGTDTFFGFSSISGNGNVLINVSAAQSGQVVWLGGGNDTVRLGGGADSLVASAAHTDGDGRDRLIGWNVAKDVLYLDGYAAGPSFSNVIGGVRATLSDGTRITFAGVSDQSAIQIVFGKPGA